jgi:hypothetical protein
MTMLDLPWPALLLQGVEAITSWESRQLGKRETTIQPTRSKLVGWAVQCYLRGTHVPYSTVLVRSQLYWVSVARRGRSPLGNLVLDKQAQTGTARQRRARRERCPLQRPGPSVATGRGLCPDAAEGPRPKRRTRPRLAPTEGQREEEGLQQQRQAQMIRSISGGLQGRESMVDGRSLRWRCGLTGRRGRAHG